jgi:LPS sulfotransferase NodH
VPIFKYRTAFKIAQNIKAFLNLEVGLIRNGDRSTPQGRGAGSWRSPRPMKGEEPNGLRAGFTPARSATRGTKDEVVPVFFLVGRSKSGTSWLMRLFNSHPEILCRGEGKFFGEDTANALHGALARSKELKRWLGHNPWTLRDQDPDLDDIVANTINYLMQEKLRKTNKKIVGDKSPFTTPGVVEEISSICPDAKVVHIIRDGRDVAVSSVHHQWNKATDQGGRRKISREKVAKREAYREDPETFGPSGESIFSGEHVAEIARSWSTSVSRAMEDAALLGDNYYQVRYEDLLAEPVGEVVRLLEFLGADSDEEVASGCVEAASFEQLSGGRTQGEEDSSSFYRKGIAGDWKNHFTEEDKQAFKEEAGELLIRLGYEEDLDW